MQSQRSAVIRPLFVEPVDFSNGRGKPILRPPKQWLRRVRLTTWVPTPKLPGLRSCWSCSGRPSQHPPTQGLNMDSAFAPSSMDAVLAEADIVCSVGTNSRARARFPCIVQML